MAEIGKMNITKGHQNQAYFAKIKKICLSTCTLTVFIAILTHL
ncbi:hypothetical protein HMPREF3202_00168 [Prevotella bivia]|uniref:Uncharacterized protein n=1 Tax=Prevotella bivia TaxID=28125 RepID=A0A137T0X7_9BACT|nr:hypothetical protein HMPREF3202_00168 [Prevotella bivia]